MKKLYILFIALYSSVSFCQSSELFDETWHLEKLVKDGVDAFPPSSVTVPYVTLTFYDETSLSISVCNTGYGLIEFSEEDTFTIDGGNFAVTLMLCQNPSDQYFEYLYLFDYFMYNAVGEFSYSITTMNDGLKQLILTNEDGDLAVYYNQNLSNFTFKKKNWSFYPNPARDIMYLKNENIEEVNIEIYDMVGKLCISKKLLTNNTSINTDVLLKGIYLIKIFNENGNSQTNLSKNNLICF